MAVPNPGIPCWLVTAECEADVRPHDSALCQADRAYHHDIDQVTSEAGIAA